MAVNNVVDWQSTKASVLERSRYMLNNPFMSDIKFTCEDSTKAFYAHKYVLGTSSAVFHAMFYGGLAETEPVVHLSDTDEESLEQFLRFLYTEECTLTTDNVISVMYLSKKYMVPSLTEKCVKLITENISLNHENVLKYLEPAIIFDEYDLERRCWHVVMTRTTLVITAETFNNISQKMLALVLRRNVLNIAEVELFQAVLKWCDRQCLMNQLEVSGENRRTVLQDAVYDIRFLSMSREDFTQHVHPYGLLSADEMVSIYGILDGMELSGLKWNTERRKEYVGQRMILIIEPIEPDPGDGIPDIEDLLKIDINFHLQDGEWVGYEIQEEGGENRAEHVYAKIIEQTRESGSRFAVNSRYKIDIGEDEPVEVNKLKLYKFDLDLANEYLSYEGLKTGNSSENTLIREPATTDGAKIEVAEALQEIWQLPESEKSSAIKRLIRIWHPHNNHHRGLFAQEVMKFLLKEVKRLNKGRIPDYQGLRLLWKGILQYYQMQKRPKRKRQSFKRSSFKRSRWEI